MCMATTVLDSDLEPNNNPTNIAGEELADDVSHDVVALDTTSGAQEDIPNTKPLANTPSTELTQLTGNSDSLVPESNPSENTSSQLSRNGNGLRKFLSSAKERFDNVEPGWAQRRTN